jgi:esterase/lipase
MKKILAGSGVVLAAVILIYLLGPVPPKPAFKSQLPVLNTDLVKLEEEITEAEKAVKEVKLDNQARIVWYNPARKEKTKYSIVYLHGFGASQAEGAPVHTQLAKKFGCNLYLARLRDHGVNNENTFAELTPENYFETAAHALAVGKQLGDSVIIIGTSTGGSFALYEAAHHPEIKAIVAYSPLIDFYSVTTALIDKPWGLHIMRMVMGSDYMEYVREDSLQSQYWMSKYRLEGLVALKSFVTTTMTAETFQQIKCPVFLGYYYKNEEEQDKVVSVQAMLQMFEQLGTPASLKRKMAFPESGHHVIASFICSKDWKSVENETSRFFKEVLQLVPIAQTPESSITVSVENL